MGTLALIFTLERWYKW